MPSHGPAALHAALAATPETAAWRLLPAPRLLRTAARIDHVIVTDRAILAITARPAATRAAAEDAALDLADFHPGSRGVPVIPVLLRPTGTPISPQFPLPLAGAAPLVEATPLTLPALFRQIARFPPLGRDPALWNAAAYAPTPFLLDAACHLYTDHDVAALRLASAGPDAIRRTQAAIHAAIATARTTDAKTIVFVTGAPGSGKTLCGLDLAFMPASGAAFLTGNPTLVHILRDALVRDATARGADPRAARRRVDAVIQALPRFRDHYAVAGIPPERLLVIDEAQRCWTAAHAIHATRKRPTKLHDSEPAHLLSIMERRPGWAAIVCLLGGGQEIYDGEGGLAAWGEALERHSAWTVHASGDRSADPRQRLPPGLPATRLPELQLATPIRAIRAPTATAWVDAVLADDSARAAHIAATLSDSFPFTLTRSLDDMRIALRQRGSRTAALIASSTARRLRAEGLGAVLPHQDDGAVCHWFLSRWPDIRSSDALEIVGTEFAVQGLEFDRAGLCWDADLIRGTAGPTPSRWEARRFRATAWTRASPAARANRLNAYRVLLTRARHGTIIWVPRGDRLEWLTLRPAGDPVLPEDVIPKRAEDRALLRRYAIALDADVVALEEVDGPQAAAEIFPPDRYALFFTHDEVVQRVGFAVRRGIAVTQNPDLVALDVNPNARFHLRSGADITLDFPDARLRLLGLHLKSGCHDAPLGSHAGRTCDTLRRQIAPLQGWIAQRREEGVPFALLGDFNRRMDGRDEMLAALTAAAPLLRVTEGRSTPCWGGNSFIDHIMLGGAARAWLEPNSMRVMVYREGADAKDRLSDHCPVSVRLDLPG